MVMYKLFVNDSEFRSRLAVKCMKGALLSFCCFLSLHFNSLYLNSNGLVIRTRADRLNITFKKIDKVNSKKYSFAGQLNHSTVVKHTKFRHLISYLVLSIIN